MADAMNGDSADARERPIGELVKDLSQQTSTLVRQEIELARAELQQQGKAMATWVAALIVMALWAVLAAVVAKAGQKSQRQATPPAPQTIETVKEDIQWAKNQTGSAPR